MLFFVCDFVQYTSKGGLPSRSLETNICAVCGQHLVLSSNDDDDDDNGPEKTYKLSCGHLYPYIIACALLFDLVLILIDQSILCTVSLLCW